MGGDERAGIVVDRERRNTQLDLPACGFVHAIGPLPCRQTDGPSHSAAPAGYHISDIYLLDLTEDLKPKGEPRRLTSLKGFSYGPAWTPNGREIIFASFFLELVQSLEGIGFGRWGTATAPI